MNVAAHFTLRPGLRAQTRRIAGELRDRGVQVGEVVEEFGVINGRASVQLLSELRRDYADVLQVNRSVTDRAV